MRSSVLLLALALAAAAPPPAARAQAQTGSVAGRVVDSASQRALPGARVNIVGSTIGALTRDDGSYTISGVPTGAQRVRVNMIGFGSREQTVIVIAGRSATADFQISHAAVKLSEVVVVGYGTQRREDVTGSVGSVSSEDLQKTAVTSVEQGLQGRIAGVQVTQGDAAPGGGLRVQIRGTNSFNAGSAQPLYVIDGVPVASAGQDQGTLGAQGMAGANRSFAVTNPLATLSPSDIESIDVLKDASATAIYGSRGANGVVLITTKKGRTGTSQFAMQVQQGYSSVANKLDVLTAPEYAEYVNTSFAQGYGTPPSEFPYGGRNKWAPDTIRKYQGNGIDWQDEIFKTAPVTDGSLTWSGGDDKGNFLIGGNLLQQQGTIIGSDFRRGGLRSNVDRQLNSRMRVQSNMTLTRSNNSMVRTATSTSYLMQGIVRLALTYVPMRGLNADTAQIGDDPRAVDNETWSVFGATPDRYTDEVQDKEITTRGLGNVKLVTTLGRGFSLDLGISGNYENKGYNSYLPRTVPEAQTLQGVAVQSGSEFTNLISDNLLRFQQSFGTNHRVDAVGGYSYEHSRSQWERLQVSGFPNDLLGSKNLALGANVAAPGGDIGLWDLASYLGRVNYSAFDRYNFTATIRADGSSKFAKNNKWATFTSGAVAWRVLEEPWLKGRTGPMNDFKLRLSYGESGNQGIGAYQSLAALCGGASSYGTVYNVCRLPNPDLKWETTAQSDLGLDFGLFGSRLMGTVDVYRKMTRDLLQPITVAPSTGFSTTQINSGNVRNKGIEGQLTYSVLTGAGGAPSWSVTGTASRNRNVIVSLGNGNTVQFAGDIGYGGPRPFIQQPGLPIGAMWGYVVEGILKDTSDATAWAALKKLQPDARYGSYLYKNLNGDAIIDDKDRQLVGDANPDWTWGLSNSLGWKRLDVSFLFTGQQGGDIINADRLRYLEINGRRNLPRYYVDRAWDPTNPDSKGIYAMIDNGRGGVRFSNYIVEDGSYVRLRNVQVGVRLPERLLRGASNTRVYANGINLLTWTKYTGYDPEVSAFGGTDRPGVDLGSYPMSRIVTFGVSTSF